MIERELAIYISASAEMDAECELLGQRLADVPRAVRWLIKRTPGSYENGNPDLDALVNSDFYLILLGMDISAPIGVEWTVAREAELTTFAFRNISAVPSPAAAFFIHNAGTDWQRYQTPQEFIYRFERLLISRLIEGTPGYGLSLSDIEELTQRLRVLDEAESNSPSDERRGAGRGGVILPSD